MLKLSFPLGTGNYDTFSVFEERPGKFVIIFTFIKRYILSRETNSLETAYIPHNSYYHRCRRACVQLSRG